jgi:hypothetical protein
MISSTSSSSGAQRPELNRATGAPAARPTSLKGDQLSTQHAEALRSALVAQPEIRPDVVARARALAADPTYPSSEVIRRIAAHILAGPDLSEEAT